MPRYVWRLETERACQGVFNCGVIRQQVARRCKHDPREHPNPSEDPGLRDLWADISGDDRSYRRTLYCGFATLAQYRQWFRGRSRWVLAATRADNGERVVLRRYLVPDDADLHRGWMQVLFQRAKSVVVDERDPCTLKPINTTEKEAA